MSNIHKKILMIIAINFIIIKMVVIIIMAMIMAVTNNY